MANELHTNRSALSQYINTKYGCTFSEWVSTLRIEEAKLIIVEKPWLSIEQVATQCGFTSQSYFSKQFNIIEGMTPTQWRKQRLLGGAKRQD